MSRSYQTEGVVLRSIRFGEADRILHIYTAKRGRVGAIAKGVRRMRSRFGGRLEPFFRLNLMLYRGRGELATVTQAQTVDPYANLRKNGKALDTAGRGAEAVLRLLSDNEPNPAAYNLLCRYLSVIDRLAAADDSAAVLIASSQGGAIPDETLSNGTTEDNDWKTVALVFRVKLLLATGFAPQVTSCAMCGAPGPLIGFSAQEGGMVCESCGHGAFSFSSAAHDFMQSALAAPISEYESAETAVLRQVDRAIRETLDYHAHVRLSSVA